MTPRHESNHRGPGGLLEYVDSAKEALTVIERYDNGGLCGECHYFDENGLEIQKETFLQNFLPRKENGELDNPLYESFDVLIDQSNTPQTLTLRPHLDARDRGRRLVAALPFGQQLLQLLKRKNRNIGKKAA